MPSAGKHCLILIAFASLALSGVGCARSLNRIDVARDAFAAGDFARAQEGLQELATRKGRYQSAAELDLAIVELASGDPKSAETRLRLLRDQFESAPDLSLTREAASMVTDDTARRYHPSGYEEVMIRTMLAIGSLASDGFDAESYALQASMKQSELAQRAEEQGRLGSSDAYQPIAIAPYIRGMLREATHHDYDDAARQYQLVSSVRPQFAPASADIERASGGVHSAPGHGVLYVIACVGRGPVLRETTAPTTSTALAIASSVLNAETNQDESDEDHGRSDVVLPNIASVKVPEVVIPLSDVAAVGVNIGDLYGATQTLTDVGELAARQVEAEMPWTIARAVVRRATKEASVAKAGDVLGLTGTAGSLFHFAAASAWSGVENADTRCWGLLPREIQVFRAELPAGQHEVSLSPLGFAGEQVGPYQSRRLSVVDGRNNYLVVVCPTNQVHVVGSK